MPTTRRVLTEDQMPLQRPVEGIRNDPPVAPSTGTRYLVGAAGINGFSGHSHEIATCTGAGPTWNFDAPVYGWEVFDWGTGLFYQYQASTFTWESRTIPPLLLNSTPGSDHVATGMIAPFTAHETVAFGQVVFVNSDGEVAKADADASTSMPAIGLVVTGGNASDTVTVLTHGYARDASWSWTVGGLVYVDTATAGGLTQTAPSGTGDQVQAFGVATHADRILVNPSLVLVEVA